MRGATAPFMRTLIKNALAATEPREGVSVKGWVRTRRDSKGFSFLELNDGSCLANLQVVIDAGTPGSEHLPQFTTGASVAVEGNLVASPAAILPYFLFSLIFPVHSATFHRSAPPPPPQTLTISSH